jgi:hypothetical protein
VREFPEGSTQKDEQPKKTPLLQLADDGKSGFKNL